MQSILARDWRSVRHAVLRFLLLLVTGVAAFFALVLPTAVRSDILPVRAGQVAQQDLQAPYDIQYESLALTEQKRQQAADAVAPIYTPADQSIARHQIESLRAAFVFIDSIRQDAALSVSDKKARILAYPEIQLTPESVDFLLAISEPRWEAVKTDALRVLEQVMRSTVREENVPKARSSLPAIISLELTEDQAALAAQLAGPLIVPNSVYSLDETAAARQAARDAVQPVRQDYVEGEIVVQRGTLITAAQYEALQQMGLIQQRDLMADSISAGALVILFGLFISLYFYRRKPGYLYDARSLILIAFLFLVFLLVARVIIPGRTVMPYLFPLAAFALLLSTLFGTGAGLILSIAISVLVAYGQPSDLMLYYMCGALCGAMTLGKARRVTAFFWAGLVIALAGTAVVIVYRVPPGNLDWIGLLTLIGASIFNGFASASIALLLQYFLAEILGLTTALRLLEISRPDAPLLQQFLRNAPGTYQHSLQVANLAEQAAEAIGLDTLLVRVGALYHDCGKAINPAFFVENQIPGSINSHDDLAPQAAAQTIVRHVTEGLALARKHRLPKRIQEFISEHHGTLTARYHYNRAVENAGGDKSKVDPVLFRYPGPKPHSRETALLMLADGVEARARAERPKDEDELRALIRRVVDFCQQDGQLDDTRLTLREISQISEAFVTTLRGIYHPRLEYPKLENMAPDVPTIPSKERTAKP
jgi:hypothetical protein